MMIRTARILPPWTLRPLCALLLSTASMRRSWFAQQLCEAAARVRKLCVERETL